MQSQDAANLANKVRRGGLHRDLDTATRAYTSTGPTRILHMLLQEVVFDLDAAAFRYGIAVSVEGRAYALSESQHLVGLPGSRFAVIAVRMSSACFSSR